jgi:hypothetical protein
MGQPSRSDVHVNKPLTNISVAYLQDQSGFISDKVFPNVPVKKQSDKYFIYDKDAWFRSDAQKRAPSTESAGSGYTLSQGTYSCDVFALHKDIDDDVRANADKPLDMDRDATMFVTRQMLMKREQDFKAKYFGTGIWTGGTGGTDVTPTTKWDASGATPIDDITNEIDVMEGKTGFAPNVLVLPKDVWTAIKNSPDFLNRVKTTSDKIVTIDLLAKVLEIDKVYIAKAVQNTAIEGATAALSYLYTDAALLVHAAPNPSIMQPTAGYTFSWNGRTGTQGQGQRVSKFRHDLIKSDRIEAEMTYDQKLVAADLGVYFDDVLT